MRTIIFYAIIFCMCFATTIGFAQTPDEKEVHISALKTEMNDAINKIVSIVNQPVTHLPRDHFAKVAKFSPGWFHAGAIEPDFNHVDIRKTQKFPYAKFAYVTSDLNPDEMFLASELEFNAMTKFFYTDRTVPKKRLSEAEMLEINRLYRIIGKNEDELGRLQNRDTTRDTSKKNPLPKSAMMYIIILGIFLSLLYIFSATKRT